MVVKVLHQLLLALRECHKKRDGVHKVLHRDLKPANVFLDSRGNVKLGDFGLARILHHNFSLAQTFIGTPYYMSPEVFSEKAYDEKSDLWSLGCLIHELCTLSPPFTARDQQALAAKVLQGKVRRIPHYYSANLQSIIDSLLATEPSRRPDIATLLGRVEGLGPPATTPATTTTTTTRLSKSDLKLWESELQGREKQLVTREGEVERREREVRVRETELLRKERALRIRESVLLGKERRHRDIRIANERDERLLREVHTQKENIKFDLQPVKK
ncbi:Serine/threonine-protein kinase Nek2 [Geodia barretti]|nr:Serine/threonine-protein kinase Nek2 [Geodia barretti]